MGHAGDSRFNLKYIGKFVQGDKYDLNVFSIDHLCCCMESELLRRKSGSSESLRGLHSAPGET